ncbi:MAG: vWA domain-containing protein [Rikenellaceae bacterium]
MYSKSITRKNRALFIIAIDQSCSMAGELIIAGRTLSKAEMVAEVASDLIAELIERSRRSEGIRDYYDVAVIGYSGEGVRSILSPERWISITELDKLEVEKGEVEREYRLSDGELRLFRHHVRRWITPTATGSTPMYEALLTVHDIAQEWISSHENRESFPPIIYNITDGESTDCDYDDIAEVASKIKSISTLDGQALLFNVHIASSHSEKSILFPSLAEMAAWESCSRSALSLFHSASHLPELFRDAMSHIKEPSNTQELKAMSFNCSMTELITILNIGSISIKRK